MDTDRLRIHIANQAEMENFISLQENTVLRAAYTEMLNGCMSNPEKWEWYAIWMIELKNGTHIGELCFKGLNENGSAEIGYGISEEYQGNGYATEAVNAVVNWALKQADVTSVTAETEACNFASVRVLEKCGFIRTGTFGEEGPQFKKSLSDRRLL